jgi:hypothetical protein
MEESRASVRVSMDLDLAPEAAFAVIVEELVIALAKEGMSFEMGAHGLVTEDGREVGRVVTWQPGTVIQLQRWVVEEERCLPRRSKAGVMPQP